MAHYLLKSILRKHAAIIMAKMQQGVEAQETDLAEKMGQEPFMESMSEALDMLQEVDAASNGKLTATMMRMAAVGIVKDLVK